MKKRIFAAIIAAVFVVLNVASALPAIALDESTTKYVEAESNVSGTVETKGILMGDADQNGVIAINDALIIMRTALRLENREPESCDVNGDGLLTMADALLILRVSLHLSEEFYRIEYLTGFEAIEDHFLIGNEMDCVFTVNADGNMGRVELCDGDGNTIGIMHDDGQNGDETANDGLFSISIPVLENEICTKDYYARFENVVSNTATISFIERPSEELVSDAQEIENKLLLFRQMNASNIDVKEYAYELLSQGRINKFECTDCSVVIEHVTGIVLVYGVLPEGTYGESDMSDTQMRIKTFQPLYDWVHSFGILYTPEGSMNEADLIPTAGNILSSNLTNCNYDSTDALYNGSIPLNEINAIGRNQIVLWQGHGEWGGNEHHSLLCTNRSIDWDAFWWDAGYCIDMLTERIVDYMGYETVSAKYIKRHCKNMNGTYVYLGPCHSGRDSTLAQAFISKGAKAVIGNTREVICEYGDLVEYTTTKLLAQINPTTGNFYCLGEALEQAKELYGHDDSVYFHGAGAIPTLFGGDSAYNYRLGNNSENSGSITGKVCKASDHVTPISGADIKVYAGNSLIKSTLSNASGNYELQLPAGDYRVNISADGYIAFSSYVTVNADENFYMETFLLVEGSEEDNGTASGYITNALTGSGVSDVSITVRNGWNNTCIGSIVTTASTNGSGAYSLELPLGNYTLALDKDGFISTHINIVVQNGITSNQNGSISPILDATGTYRIVLTWGENPDDLDSHVEGTLSNGNHFHVYYSHQSQYDGSIEVCNLDVDDTTSYGPETITLIPTTTDPYYYYIHHYAGSGSIASSEAKIRLYQGETMIAEFNAPANQGTDLYWNVFAIVNGELVVRNTITSYADVSYAD